MASKKTRKRYIYAKAEVTYDTDPVADASNAILCGNIRPIPFNTNLVQRVVDQAKFGGRKQFNTEVHAGIEFEVEAVGSGTLGTPPAWGILMQACGCLETIVASTSVAYDPDTDATDSLTIVYNVDGQEHKLTGCRGTFECTFNHAGVPMIKFRFLGNYVAVVDSAAGATTGFADFLVVKPVSKANTTFSLAGTSLTLNQFTFTQGNDLQFFGDEGVVEINDRNSTGNVRFLGVTMATFNHFTQAFNETLVSLNLSHDQTVGQNVKLISTNKTQIMSPDNADDRNRQMAVAQLGFQSDNDDEWQILLDA